MKFLLIALPLCVLGVSCERHSFEETKQLHESHGSHASHDSHGAEGHAAEGHGHGEAKPAEHGH